MTNTNTITIELSWHKAGSFQAATYAQINYIFKLAYDASVELPFRSNTQGQRKLTKAAASQLIEALQDGDAIVFDD
jgi:hypothetical protein